MCRRRAPPRSARRAADRRRRAGGRAAGRRDRQAASPHRQGRRGRTAHRWHERRGSRHRRRLRRRQRRPPLLERLLDVAGLAVERRLRRLRQARLRPAAAPRARARAACRRRGSAAQLVGARLPIDFEIGLHDARRCPCPSPRCSRSRKRMPALLIRWLTPPSPTISRRRGCLAKRSRNVRLQPLREVAVEERRGAASLSGNGGLEHVREGPVLHVAHQHRQQRPRQAAVPGRARRQLVARRHRVVGAIDDARRDQLVDEARRSRRSARRCAGRRESGRSACCVVVGEHQLGDLVGHLAQDLVALLAALDQALAQQQVERGS